MFTDQDVNTLFNLLHRALLGVDKPTLASKIDALHHDYADSQLDEPIILDNSGEPVRMFTDDMNDSDGLAILGKCKCGHTRRECLTIRCDMRD